MAHSTPVSLRAAALLIAKKELMEISRDRRSLVVLLLVPVLLYPLLLLGMALLTTSQLRKLAAQTHVVWVERFEATPAPLRSELSAAPTAGPGFVRLELAPLPVGEDPARALSERRVAAVIRGVDRAEAALERGEAAEVEVLFHSGIDTSNLAQARIEQALRRWGLAVAKERLERAKLSITTLDPVRMDEQDVGPSGALFARMLAALLVMLSLTGAFYPALDLGAGEKERGSLETLLIAPVPRVGVALGKMGAVATVAAISAALHLTSLGLTFGATGQFLPQKVASLSIDPFTLFAALIVLLPLVGLTSAIALALSSFAASYKEGNAYLTPLLLLGTCVPLVTALPGTRLDLATGLIPGISASLLLRELLAGTGTLAQVLLVVSSSLLWAWLAVRWAASLYDQEEVLLRPAAAPGPDLLGIAAKRSQPFQAGRGPTIPQALALAALVLGLIATAGQDLQGRSPLFGLVATLLLLLLTPTVAYARLLGCDLKETFGLRRPGWGALAAVPCFALGLVLLLPDLAALQAQLSGPVSPEEKRAIAARVSQLEQLGPFSIGLLLAVLPAICEEALFRGFVLRGLLPAGRTVALLGSAALFALAHLDPGRLLPAFAGGLCMGTLVLFGRSIGPAILLHAATNGGTLLASEGGPLAALHPEEPGFLHRGGGVAAIALGVGLAWLGRVR